MKLCEFLLLYVTVALSATVWATDYCNPQLCVGKGKHIACNSNASFDPVCPEDAKTVDISRKLQKKIVEKINERRNFIAGGGDSSHDPACRMATIQWDNELAELAALNVKQCSLKHDSCHNTDVYKYVGQNVALHSSSLPLNVKAEFKKILDMWYTEVSYSSMKNIKKYPSKNSGPNFGHFTVLMIDKNVGIGCAASTYTTNDDKPMNTLLIACNFATNNMIDFPTYKDCSKAAAECKSGVNPEHPNLCSTSEVYEVNKWP